MGFFLLSMVLHPEVQRRAQDELDRVVEPGSLPDFSDEPQLPYITAIVREVLRWEPVGPTGIPHIVAKDDEYRGYDIPKGSLVIGNLWYVPRIGYVLFLFSSLAAPGLFCMTRSNIQSPPSLIPTAS